MPATSIDSGLCIRFHLLFCVKFGTSTFSDICTKLYVNFFALLLFFHMHVVWTLEAAVELVTHDSYDQVSERLRQFAAAQLMELLGRLAPMVAEATSDAAALHDVEPGRLQAHTALLKVHLSALQQLGALYRVTERPREDREESLPLAAVQRLLVEQEERLRVDHEAAVAAAVAAAVEAAALRERLSLEAARASVASGLARLR